MAGIRISRGIEIDVNDNGETITIPVQDQKFTEKFYDLLNQLDQLAKEKDEMEQRNVGEREQISHSIEKTKEMMKKLDEMFGENCCRKVFGDMIPGPYALADFFDQLRPIIEEYTDERKKSISQKYNRNRKGQRTGRRKS